MSKLASRYNEMGLVDARDLLGSQVEGLDGPIGTIEDFYFDRENFFIRYFLVNAYQELGRSEVAISPISLSAIQTQEGLVSVYLSRQEVLEAPRFRGRGAPSRDEERAFNQYYHWPDYWEGRTGPWDLGPFGMPWAKPSDKTDKNDKTDGLDQILATPAQRPPSQCLELASDMTTFCLESKDKEFGHILSFLISTEDFQVKFLVGDTSKFLCSKQILLRVDWIKSLNWKAREVHFPFAAGLVENAPSYDNEVDNAILWQTEEHFFPRPLANTLQKKGKKERIFPPRGLLRPKRRHPTGRLIHLNISPGGR